MLPTNPLLHATAPAGPHLPVPLLRQYAAGTLAPAAQHRVEAHTLACPRCADILEGLLQTPPATTDQALAQLQQRLRQRVQQQAAPARLMRETRQPRWLVPQLAAAAALLFGLLAGGWWAWQQRHLATAATNTAASAPAPPVASPPSRNSPLPQAPTPPLTAKAAAPAAPRQLALGGRAARRVAGKRPASRTAGLTAKTAAPTAKDAPQPALTADARAPMTAAPSHADTAAPTGRAAPAPLTRLAADPETARRLAAPMPAAPPLAPAPVGGLAALRDKLRREAAEFVPEAPERPLSGTVQLRLTIGADGKLEKISVLRGLRADYDAEAQRLVREGPTWVPGVSGGRRAAQVVEVAVPF